MRTPTRTRQAKKPGQTTLLEFYDLHSEVIEKVIETTPSERRGYEYINKNIINSVDSVQQPLLKPIHKGHRYLFIYSYEGPQPIRNADSVSLWGRYRTVKQAKFYYYEDKTIIFTLPHTLKVWVMHPKGERTVKELMEAREIARRVVKSFVRKYGIKILKEKNAGFSEHTVEDKALDSILRPIVQAEPEISKEHLGLSINQTSHKNKVEWTGKSAKERVMAIEWWLDEGIASYTETQKLLLQNSELLANTIKEIKTLAEQVQFLINKDKR
jgi:hypothetical protein